MKTHLVLALTLACTSAAFGLNPNSPIEEARKSLENAHSMVSKKEAGGTKVTMPKMLTALSNAELHLEEAKKNKGTNTSVALKAIADAKAELEAHKQDKDGGHLEKADAAIQDAIKHVMQAIHTSKH